MVPVGRKHTGKGAATHVALDHEDRSATGSKGLAEADCYSCLAFGRHRRDDGKRTDQLVSR